MKKRATKAGNGAGAEKGTKRPIESYAHGDKERANNPPVGLVTPETDPVEPARKTYQYDPHLDPQLTWAGKAERTSFEVPVVSLHVHERIDPKTIIAAVRTNGEHHTPAVKPLRQPSLFEEPRQNPPLRDALDFYKHPHDWTNRLIAGDSLLVMNSLLEKEGMAGKVQMIYIDPPYGIRYGSNFQPFVNRREVKDGKDEDLTQEPETVRAFRDTWELGIHSYLTYLRDRLLLARELLHESGSIFIQISDENLHHVRELADEVFGSQNFCSVVTIAKTAGASSTMLAGIADYLLWYARDKDRVKYRQLYTSKEGTDEGTAEYRFLLLPDGSKRPMTREERENPAAIPAGSERYRPSATTSQRPPGSDPFEFAGRVFVPGKSQYWKTSVEGLQKLGWANRIIPRDASVSYLRKLNDFPVKPINNLWLDTRWGFDAQLKRYVVETNSKVVTRCILMCTDVGDVVFDPTCGSGTTAAAGEFWGRRWIVCDTSRVAITLAKQRLMTASYDYFALADLDAGVAGGFRYKSVPHITLKSIANNPDIKEGMTRKQIDDAIARHAETETLYDQPEVDDSRVRVTGPFTVEAVPAINVRIADAASEAEPTPADSSVARLGPTLRQDEWRDELSRAGVRGKGGAKIEFARLEPLPGVRHLHAIGETRDKQAKTVVVSFGPEHAPLEQRQVEHAWEEARGMTPKPDILLFAAFHFDPEAAKDIDELDPKKAGMQFLKLQMNTDLLTEDLKKKRSSNESFWLIGQPDVELRRQQPEKGEAGPRYVVQVNGFDYYNPVNGKVESGDTSKIAMWLLDTDYDGRSLYPQQVFFPMAGDKEGWAKLAKNLKAEIDEDLIEAYRGTESLPFTAGKHRRVAVKIVDDRGIESLKIIATEG